MAARQSAVVDRALKVARRPKANISRIAIKFGIARSTLIRALKRSAQNTA